MTKLLEKIATPDILPAKVTVVIIGGGIVGVSAALAMAEKNIDVVLIEKGHIACEQSSRNLGWIRKTSRHAHDVPLAAAADKMWVNMAERVGEDVGYRQNGIMFLTRSDEQMSIYDDWLNSVADLQLDSRLMSAKDIDVLVPGGKGDWKGGIYTPSDGRAEPAKAATAIAKAAQRKGVTIVQNCAVRTLLLEGGKVTGVATEKGEIRCEQVLLCGGAWSRRFLGNLGVSLPTLPLVCSVLRTTPMEGPSDIAVGGPDFSFRKHDDGGYIVTQRGGLDAHVTPDHLLIGMRYLEQLKTQRSFLRIKFGKEFFKQLGMAKTWDASTITPFEKYRINDPAANPILNNEALTNLRQAWPVFEQAQIAEAWAGILEVTPDSNPVIERIDQIPGLTIATGFSGHGFGTGPAAGQLAADLVLEEEPIVDPTPYRFSRL
ncbi:FAD-binding oxidoreductase [Maribrevibacterium harenarium]|uniref:FAD-binding oxidoreductase n=1 Tax=Maribrevibacterium harenarium TaxID=2589817 RepID=A0A501X1T1_9GAMM|nr:FAD-binding oxidoreductase [Maribrevibacterium harenarium]TPE54436.1 FAD-binding oxidoreductase [Maribrevibacterium harenarium]